MSIDTSTAIAAVTLAEAKLHLRVDHTSEDTLIESLALSATQMAEHELQIGLVTRTGTAGFGAVEDVPVVIKQWILLHVGHWFANREAATEVASEPLPFAGRLLDPFRTWA